MIPQSEQASPDRLLSAVLLLTLTVVLLTGTTRQAPSLVTGLDHIIILVNDPAASGIPPASFRAARGGRIGRRRASLRFRDALQAAGLKPVAGTSRTILLPPEQTYGIWLEFRESR